MSDTDRDGVIIKEGDHVCLEYTAVTVTEGKYDDERLVDTTDKDRILNEGVGTGGQYIGPRTIVVGEENLFKRVENALIGKEVGDKGEVVVPAEDGFGDHDPDNVETVSVSEIDENNRHPGERVDVDGRQGYVETIVGGRARIDFNHPFDGEDIRYEFEIVDVLKPDSHMENQPRTSDTNIYVGRDNETETKIYSGNKSSTVPESNETNQGRCSDKHIPSEGERL